MKKTRQYRSNQGRSPKQQQGNYVAAAISFLGLLMIILYLMIIN